ncbi:carbonic anhydrase [Providencia sneebia]|uniref:Carbonic anhydrase n=1 Tax=Providencia sneebia DSM 19967 TaxID=1141660 RepID=K8W6R9_9GAMM|nr:carbonic anhydrase family protein [Providencia sneebia]EKT55561.1 carbonic anhydrase [Providencia sneebia DSM 19967]
MSYKRTILCILTAFAFSSHANSLWTYEGSGAPENWGKLSDEFKACENGFNQSPINIDNVIDGKLKPLNINIHTHAQKIINNGHSIQINVNDDDDFSIDGSTYQLKQFHFHSPSENEIKGQQYPLELHFVHAKEDGQIAVLAIMLEEGEFNPAIEQILSNIPKEKDQEKELGKNINLTALYPEDKSYYRFSGSLTTPPCTEGVVWLVMKQPIKASQAQIRKFQKALGHANNRPIQPLHGRLIVN